MEITSTGSMLRAFNALLSADSSVSETSLFSHQLHRTRDIFEGVIRDGLLATAGALSQMAAERGRAAALDSPQHTKMLPGQSGSVLLDKAFARCSNDVGHLERWRVHLLCSLRDRLTCFASENWALSIGVPAAFR